MSGYGTDQAYLFYKKTGTSFEADEVILVFTPYNDIETNLASRQYGHDKPYFTLEDNIFTFHAEGLKENPIQTIINKVWSKSRVINLLFTVHRTFQNWQVLKKTKGGTATPGTGPLGPLVVTDRELKGVA